MRLTVLSAVGSMLGRTQVTASHRSGLPSSQSCSVKSVSGSAPSLLSSSVSKMSLSVCISSAISGRSNASTIACFFDHFAESPCALDRPGPLCLPSLTGDGRLEVVGLLTASLGRRRYNLTVLDRRVEVLLHLVDNRSIDPQVW